MSLEVEYSNDALKLEERVFLLNTVAGRFIIASVTVAISLLYCIALLSSKGLSLFSVDAVVIVAASIFLAMLTLFFGYAWMNSGGHVSTFFEMKGRRTYAIVEQMNTLKVDDFGVVKEFSLNKCRLLRRQGKVFVIISSKVSFIPVTASSKEFIGVLESLIINISP